MKDPGAEYARALIGNDRFRPKQISSHMEILTDFVPHRFRPTQISSHTDFVPFFNIETDFVPFLTDFVPNNYYNVVRYVHIPLVP